MNTNTGKDPMLCGFICEDWRKLSVDTTITSSLHPLPLLTHSSGSFNLPMDGLFSPEPNSAFTDLTSLWAADKKPESSLKNGLDDDIDDDEDEGIMCSNSCSDPGDDMGLDDIEVNSTTTMDIKSELDADSDFNEDNVSMVNSVESFEPMPSPEWVSVQAVSTTNTLQLSEKEARKFVQDQFDKIACLPGAKLSHRDKINFILAQSDCKDFSTNDILSFDKRKSESARACAKIVQNIPQRYRWECVTPEEIPCCYTIVADCKKISGRDKPPRPMNAFMIWAQGARRLINVLCPKMQNALISEALGFYWRQKSDDFKNRFEMEKVKLRRFHNVEFPEYKYKPKTKVQKAKEKQELSMSKAKIRATLKKERLQERRQQKSLAIETPSKGRVSAKCGRPKKVKTTGANQNNTTKGQNTKFTHSQSKVSTSANETVHSSPTKPAIKDMLTLKILNDQRTKKQLNSNYTPIPSPTFSSTSSDISSQPEFTRSSSIGNLLDELETLESFLGDDYKTAPEFSVYETPTNTPLMSDSHQQQLQQPMQHFFSPRPINSPAPSSSSPSLSMSPPLPTPSMPVRNTCVSSQYKPAALNPSSFTTPSVAPPTSSASRPQILMPSLSAMLASPAKASPYTRNISNIQCNGRRAQFTLDPLSQSKTTTQGYYNPRFSNVFSLQCIGKNVMAVPIQSQGKPVAAACSLRTSNLSSANNSKTIPFVNKLVHCTNGKRAVLSENLDANNNKAPPPSYAMSVMNFKVLNAAGVPETSDLESLSLDLNVPLLSEDVMRTYIDSL